MKNKEMTSRTGNRIIRKSPSLSRPLRWCALCILINVHVACLTPHLQKFVHEEITKTLLTYLSRHEEFSSNEQMKRVVNLLHRQAVRAKAEGLFFKVRVVT